MEIKVYNARPIQKCFVIIGVSILVFLCLLGYFLGGMYKSERDSIIMFSIIGGVIATGFITYFVARTFYDSQFVFDEEGITRNVKGKATLNIKWDEVISIGHFRILDFFNIDWGPGIMGLDYIDGSGKEQRIQVPFPLRHARILKESSLILNLIIFVDLKGRTEG